MQFVSPLNGIIFECRELLSINGFTSYYSATHMVVSPPPLTDDDRLSQLSARSAASSSFASQVLERAQRRKENFWGKM